MGLLSVIRCPSSVSQLSLNRMHGLKILVVASPGPYADTFFEFFKKKKKKKKKKNQKFRFFFVFVNMGPYRSEYFKMLLILQIAAGIFQTFNEFSSEWSSQNYVWDF